MTKPQTTTTSELIVNTLRSAGGSLNHAALSVVLRYRHDARAAMRELIAAKRVRKTSEDLAGKRGPKAVLYELID